MIFDSNYIPFGQFTMRSLALAIFSAVVLLHANLMAQSNQRVIFLGDSITQAGARPNGYVSQVRKMLTKKPGSKVEVLGAGISGHKVPDLQKRLERDVLSKSRRWLLSTLESMTSGTRKTDEALRRKNLKKDSKTLFHGFVV